MRALAAAGGGRDKILPAATVELWELSLLTEVEEAKPRALPRARSCGRLKRAGSRKFCLTSLDSRFH